MSSNQTIQSEQYEFPYHHLVDIDGVIPTFRRQMGWGFEYAFYQRFVKNRILERKHCTSLDIGCGDGWLVKQLSRSGVVASGIDTDERAISLAKALCPSVEFICGDVLNIKEEFDAVTLIKSKKGAVRGNHYHKETTQFSYILSNVRKFLISAPLQL